MEFGAFKETKIIKESQIKDWLIEALADKLVIAAREDIYINWVGEVGAFDEAQIVFIPLNQIVHLKRGKAGSWWLNYSNNGEEVSCWAADMKFAMRLAALAILECVKEE